MDNEDERQVCEIPGSADKGNMKEDEKQNQNKEKRACPSYIRFKTNKSYRRKLLKTVLLFWTFVGLGWMTGQLGPSFPDLQLVVEQTLDTASWLFTIYSFGYMAGSFAGGLLYDHFSKPLVIAFSTLIMAVTTVALPRCRWFALMLAVRFISGVGAGGLDTDQAASTYAVVLSKPAWMWGAEMGANEEGVCIGNEAVWTKVNSADDLVERLLGMDLLRLGLERGGNARESVDVITSHLEKFGQGGACVEGGDWSYHNSFIIADRSEAWVLETVCQFWVAEKITEGVRNISNQLTITTKFDLSSPNLVERATEAGLYKESDGPFNFAKVFDESSLASKSSRYCNGTKLLKKFSSNGTFSIADMMKILRDDDSGINMGSGTCGSQVSLLPSNTAAAATSPCCHWLTATPSPDVSLFKPFLFGPSSGVGNLTASTDYGEKDPRLVKPRFQSKVERRHELFKGHEKLQRLLVQDEAKGNKIFQNLKELESNCIGDMEEILKNFDESSFAKVSNLFEHMCNIELNFYKEA